MSTLSGDTIAAVSTPPGPGGVALVRLSGPRAMEIADAVFRGARPLAVCPTHTVHHGRVFGVDGDEADEVLATVLRAPQTYTTEDMVEFGCHGGTMASRRVLDVCLAAGARLARRG
ncbi:tRNA uridine-5-carboxymethylaminomethyl(34) synthesis GTPase MnmE, partial [bacterium]|nr:tRNA uridine-5-carboxymethylaminomethyl(34) synthesis GTPase MnmE [bacterium]